jgi:hypothetical protein
MILWDFLSKYLGILYKSCVRIYAISSVLFLYIYFYTKEEPIGRYNVDSSLPQRRGIAYSPVFCILRGEECMGWLPMFIVFRE